MSSDNIYDYSLPRLAEGIRKAANTVAKTMGPKGNNVVLQEKLPPFTRTTNDGATIIQAMQLADPIESMGLSFLKEAATRSNNNSGDGSTTMTVLLSAILQEGIKSGINTLEVKQSLDETLLIIEAALKDQAKEITVDDIPAVAEIAGEDKELAKKLGEIYRLIGKDGIVHLEGSGTYETSYSFIEGVRFAGTGYLSPFMAHGHKTKAIYEKPTILVTKNKIAHLNDINPLLAALESQNKKDLVIFTDDMDSGVARVLIEAHQKGVLNVLIIKAPVLWKTYVFDDFAKCVGATVIEDSSGTRLGKEIQLGWLGTCDKLICDKDEVTLIGIKDISEHVEALKADGTTDAKLRLSWLTTKTAILRLGAKSETELSWKMGKSEDAIHSSRLALQSGVLAGGGLSLRNCAELMPSTIGGEIMRQALKRPQEQILENAGYETKVLPHASLGINARNGQLVNMFEAGIVDAAAIVLGAVRNSLGIASTLLTVSSVITTPPPTQEELISKMALRPMGL